MQRKKTCPVCGSRRVQRVRETVEVHPCGRRVEVPDVQFDHCLKCGEVFFDHDASQKIDTFVFSAEPSKTA